MGEVDGKKIGCTVSLLVSKLLPFASLYPNICLFSQKYYVLFAFNPQCLFFYLDVSWKRLEVFLEEA